MRSETRAELVRQARAALHEAHALRGSPRTLDRARAYQVYYSLRLRAKSLPRRIP